MSQVYGYLLPASCLPATARTGIVYLSHLVHLDSHKTVASNHSMYTYLLRATLSRVRQLQASQTFFDNYVLYSSFFRIVAGDQAEQSRGLVCAKDGRSPVLHLFKSTGYTPSTR
jgi:hypothetical protein